MLPGMSETPSDVSNEAQTPAGEAVDAGPSPAEDGGFHCDFCGRTAPRVRRVALDRGYERLRTPHRVQYACPECSERKERERTADA